MLRNFTCMISLNHHNNPLKWVTWLSTLNSPGDWSLARVSNLSKLTQLVANTGLEYSPLHDTLMPKKKSFVAEVKSNDIYTTLLRLLLSIFLPWSSFHVDRHNLWFQQCLLQSAVHRLHLEPSRQSFPRWLRVKKICLQCPASAGDTGQKDSLKWQVTPVFLPGKSYGQRKLASYSPRGHKELDKT